ncbi:MAG: hypothetical protein SVC26_07625 [Pseudomonadota bacterium]|nr:hypothetical protein [Pseudomonadota bacterium]
MLELVKEVRELRAEKKRLRVISILFMPTGLGYLIYNNKVSQCEKDIEGIYEKMANNGFRWNDRSYQSFVLKRNVGIASSLTQAGFNARSIKTESERHEGYIDAGNYSLELSRYITDGVSGADGGFSGFYPK